jgi:chorismate dehydratase
MVRLGNIHYSNCYPIHAPLLEGEPRPHWLEVHHGSPGELNGLLARGKLDVAPCSSIELARHVREYRVLDGLCIGSDGPVESIVVASKVPLEDLDGLKVAVPTASASSRSVLRIMLKQRHGVEPSWEDFDQEDGDPLSRSDVAAALLIGDTALRYPEREGLLRLDLGSEWTKWTGLPFVYALWQVRESVAGDPELHELHRRLLLARDGFPANAPRLAEAAAARYSIPAGRLESYWTRIRYTLDERMLAGLRHFFDLAAALGEAPAVDAVRFVA